ncbi:MAG: acyltransferase family protein [Rhodobiaceae bacterium]|nr:acyltransferase family protein [Rhodobiaceae bacterium]
MVSRNETGRVDWVDYGKGFCIIFVVMMHSTLGVEWAAGQEGWMHYLVAFAKPFRMPDFFLIAGLFLSARIDKPWREYLDSKVLHFLYFYWLWAIIQLAIKEWPGIAQAGNWGDIPYSVFYAAIEPFGTLWFIYMLPVFFVVVKALKRVPVPVIWLAAAALEIAHIHTGWIMIDEFAARFVYFYTGFVAAPVIFRMAARAQALPVLGLAALLGWGVMNGVAVFGGVSEMPFVSLGLGLAGAGAVVTLSALLAKVHFLGFMRWLGQNSIVIYLAFFFPMAVTRTVLLKTGIITDIGTISVLVTFAGVAAPAIFYLLVRDTKLGFLYRRPQWARLKPAAKSPPPSVLAPQPAE